MVPRASFCGVSLPPQKVNHPTIEETPLPEKVVLPLGSDAESVCEPVVAVGDQVHTGQLLGQSRDFYTAPVHSSVSGRVVDIRPWVDQRGEKVPAVIVESDGKDSWLDETRSDEQFLEKENPLILADLRASCVVTSGPPVMPLHAKLGMVEPSKEFLFLVGIPPVKSVDTLIINGIDAEPGMAVRSGVLQAHYSEITAGIKLLQKLLTEAKVVLAVGSNGSFNPSTAGGLTELGVQVFQAKDKYPVGLNPILVKCVTGREIPLPDGNEVVGCDDGVGVGACGKGDFADFGARIFQDLQVFAGRRLGGPDGGLQFTDTHRPLFQNFEHLDPGRVR